MTRRWRAMGLGLVTLLVGMAALAAPATAQSAVERIKKAGVLRVAITPTAVGFNYKDPATNELIGVNVEVAKRFAQELGVKPEFEVMAFPALFEHLLAQRSDIVMSAVVMRPERLAKMAFSDVVYAFGFAPIVRADESRTFPNLAAVAAAYKDGKLRVGEQTNAAFVQFVKEAGIPTADIKLYTNKQDAVRDVALGRVDITFWDTPIAQHFLLQNPDVAAKVKILTDFDSPRLDNGYPMRPDDKDLVEFVNRVLAKMRQDGSLAQIAQKFGMDPKILTR